MNENIFRRNLTFFKTNTLKSKTHLIPRPLVENPSGAKGLFLEIITTEKNAGQKSNSQKFSLEKIYIYFIRSELHLFCIRVRRF